MSTPYSRLYGPQSADSPILGPYLRAQAIAQQLRALQTERENEQQGQETERLRQEELRVSTGERRRRGEEARSDLLLDLALKGVHPFQPTAPDVPALRALERGMTPERIVSTPMGEFKVLSERQQREQTRTRALEQARTKQESQDELDPYVTFKVVPKGINPFGLPPLRRSQAERLYEKMWEAGLIPNKPQITMRELQGPQGEAILVGIDSATGKLVWDQRPKGAYTRAPTKPEKPVKVTEAELRDAAETDVLKSWPELKNTARYQALSETLKREKYSQAQLEKRHNPDPAKAWQEAWEEADREIRGDPKYKDIMNPRTDPEFQRLVTERKNQLRQSAASQASGRTMDQAKQQARQIIEGISEPDEKARAIAAYREAFNEEYR